MSSSWRVGSQYWFHPQFSYTDAPSTQAALHAFQPSFHPQISCVNSIFPAKSAVFPGLWTRIHMENIRHFPVVPVARLERRHAAGGAGAHPPGPGGAARGCRHLERAAADGAAGSAGGTAESHRDGTGGKGGLEMSAGGYFYIYIYIYIYIDDDIQDLYRWNRWTWEGYGASDDDDGWLVTFSKPWWCRFRWCSKSARVGFSTIVKRWSRLANMMKMVSNVERDSWWFLYENDILL